MLARARTWLLCSAGIVGVLLAASPVHAVTVTWNTCAGGSDSTCTPGGLTPSVRTSTGTGVDETFTFQAIGDPTLLLVAEAFRTTNSIAPYGVIVKREIRIFEGGLGAGLESSPQHAVDNKGPDEMIVFRFGQDDYIPLSYTLGYRYGDSDIVTYIGGTAGGPTDILSLMLTETFNWDTFIANPAGLGFTQQTFSDVMVGIPQLFSNDASGRYLIIGAKNETDTCSTSYGLKPCEGGEDTFKIQQIVGERPNNVPEPSTLLLLVAGLVGLAPLARRRM